MNALIQAIVNYSKVEVLSFVIEEATETSFVTSIESKITQTGPVYGTILAMSCDSIGPAGKIGSISIGDTKITPSGATISVSKQTIDITDMPAFLVFLKSVMSDDKCVLTLYAKAATIKAMMIKKTIEFSKPTEVIGWKALKVEIISVKDGKAVFKIESPSQTSIDFGNAVLEAKNKEGKAVATLTGRFAISQGESFQELSMIVTPGLPVSAEDVGMVTLVGVEVKTDSWLKEGIKMFKVDVPVTKEWSDALQGKA